MKRLITVLVIALLAISAAACGSKDTGNKEAAGTASQTPKQDVTLKIFNGKVEISEQLNELKKEYEAAHPGITLQIESVMTSEYNSSLKAKYAGNEMPDIFLNGGYKDLETWAEHLEDLSDQPWVNDMLDMAKPQITLDGKIYGMPVNIEGYGIAYNKALFQKAGIETTPKTISELRDASAKLKQAGIAPFAFGLQDWFSPGVHWLNVAVAQQPDSAAFIQGMNDGSQKIPGNAVFEQWVDLIDLVLDNTNKNPLTVDYNGEVTHFANAEVAMIKAGNWSQVLMNNIDPSLELGMIPLAINDDPQQSDKFYASVPKYWVINKESKNKEQAKAFLNWLVTSETGQKYITQKFKFIPGFKSFEADPQDLGSLGADVQRYIKEGKTLGWNWEKYPEGVTQDFGSSIQKYSAKKINREQLLKEFQDSWDKMKGKK